MQSKAARKPPSSWRSPRHGEAAPPTLGRAAASAASDAVDGGGVGAVTPRSRRPGSNKVSRGSATAAPARAGAPDSRFGKASPYRDRFRPPPRAAGKEAAPRGAGSPSRLGCRSIPCAAMTWEAVARRLADRERVNATTAATMNADATGTASQVRTSAARARGDDPSAHVAPRAPHAKFRNAKRRSNMGSLDTDLVGNGGRGYRVRPGQVTGQRRPSESLAHAGRAYGPRRGTTKLFLRRFNGSE